MSDFVYQMIGEFIQDDLERIKEIRTWLDLVEKDIKEFGNSEESVRE